MAKKQNKKSPSKAEQPFFVKHKHMRWLLPLLIFSFFILLILPKDTPNQIRETDHQNKTQASVLIFFNDKETPESVDALIYEIKAIKEVRKVTYISKSEALEKYKKQIADDPLLLEYVAEDLLPSSIEVSLSSSKEVQNQIESLTKGKVFIDNVIKSPIKNSY